MKQVYVFAIIWIFASSSGNNGYCYSNSKPIIKNRGNEINFLYLGDLIKLSPNEFSMLRGKKINTWERLTFSILKVGMKQHLKKGNATTVNNYIFSQSPFKRVLFWIILGLLASIF